MEHEEGLPHERQFTIACQVLKFREIGTGKSKKLAKRMAAHKMWQALQDMPIEGNNLPQGFDYDEEVRACKGGGGCGGVCTIFLDGSYKVSQRFEIRK